MLTKPKVYLNRQDRKSTRPEFLRGEFKRLLLHEIRLAELQVQS